MIQWLKRLAAVTALALVAACGGSDDDENDLANIVATARANPQLSILVEAVTVAQLDGTLSGAGDFTVFAPTDAAFAALLTELGVTKAQLLANKPLLTAVLKYHVLGSAVEKSAVPLGRAITPLEGGIFKIDAVGPDLVFTDGRNRTGKIIATDVAATNGIVHVVDRVLLPADKTIVETAQATAGFGILVDAVIAADLVDTLSGPGPFTVFAPTDAAFAALLTELGVTKDQLFANKALLTQVLTYHVVAGRVLKAEVPVGTPITTVEGDTFSVDAGLAITDQRDRSAAITATDVLASNGVIHVIDKVILPAP